MTTRPTKNKSRRILSANRRLKEKPSDRGWRYYPGDALTSALNHNIIFPPSPCCLFTFVFRNASRWQITTIQRAISVSGSFFCVTSSKQAFFCKSRQAECRSIPILSLHSPCFFRMKGPRISNDITSDVTSDVNSAHLCPPPSSEMTFNPIPASASYQRNIPPLDSACLSPNQSLPFNCDRLRRCLINFMPIEMTKRI